MQEILAEPITSGATSCPEGRRARARRGNDIADPRQRAGAHETDLLYGTAYADTIYALADGDALVGFWGNDRIYGGPGSDIS